MSELLSLRRLSEPRGLGRGESIAAAGIVFVFFAAVVGGSVWQGLYNLDPHHYGLMLSNAKDFSDGKLPYRDIFIQYGILTTIIHAAAYGLGGANLIAIITVTGVAYAIGLVMVYRLAVRITGSFRLAIYIYLTLFLFHPIAIYPWSNYLAFPFLVYSIFLLLDRSYSSIKFFLAGISLGLAILAREGLAPAVLMLLASYVVIDHLCLDRGDSRANLMIKWTLPGLFLLLGIFFIYLAWHDLLPYWWLHSWRLPAIYAKESFPHMTGIRFFSPLAHEMRNGFRILDWRWILVFAVVAANIGVSIFSGVIALRDRFFGDGVQGNGCNTHDYLKVAIASLLMLTSALHAPDIFRLATGIMIGCIILYTLMDRLKLANVFFAVVVLALGVTFKTGMHFFPTKAMLAVEDSVRSPSYFKGQYWPPAVTDYYQNIERDLIAIKNAGCGVHYQYNGTIDAFLLVVSPFEKFHFSAWATKNASINGLRQDLDFKAKIAAAQDIVIVDSIDHSELGRFYPPDGFFLYSQYTIPANNWTWPDRFGKRNAELLILVPTKCSFMTTLSP